MSRPKGRQVIATWQRNGPGVWPENGERYLVHIAFGGGDEFAVVEAEGNEGRLVIGLGRRHYEWSWAAVDWFVPMGQLSPKEADRGLTAELAAE